MRFNNKLKRHNRRFETLMMLRGTLDNMGIGIGDGDRYDYHIDIIEELI